ncbi:signal peptide peptidase SppA [Aureivirga sp. CE67]|uniref:signal peptide peptidase SppA n=1 Tax=Aureivirga sp. CE67 TaxID=1788983 RepID=UPI0018C93469|nr:signal peptide peptidase SppA [Aureivirga sp. CE67]
MKFLRNLVASILGFFIAGGIIFVLFFAIIFSLENEDKVVVKSNSVLKLDLSNAIKDYAPKEDNPFEEILGLSEGKLSLNEILNAIENAKSDPKIKGINIETLGVSGGVAQIEAIREKLIEFKDSGKFIKAYSDVYDQKNYYLSSVADSIFVNPVGGMEFTGLSSEVLFYKDFEDKYGIKMEVIRHGKYKSAVEPYIANKMSDANREQITSFLKSIWGEMLEDISKSRKLSVEELNNIADNLLARNPELAKENKLIDGIIYKDTYVDNLKKDVGIDSSKTLNQISLAKYIKSGKGKIVKTAKDKVAVIYAQGEIIYGEGNKDKIGQELINKALRKARKDKNVKAIVLRVNSPGGSALASDIMWRELELTKKEKPIVVSMGNVAASGGYYISCNADYIFAEPTTITGSIGVFGAVPNVSEFVNKIGINAEQVTTNKSKPYSLFEPMSEDFYNVTKEGVEMIYKTFVNRVAEGRKMTFEQVNEIAQGRVWSGAEAKANGLVDELGGLEKAIAKAAELGEVSDFRISNYPRYKTDLKESLQLNPFMNSKESILKEELGETNYTIYKNIKELSNLKGIQARLPFMIEVK